MSDFDLNHGLAVAREVEGGDAKLVALLHDAVATGGTTPDAIRRCVDPGVAYAVEILTLGPDEDYREYILRLAVATGYYGDIAQRVKIADLTVDLALMDAAHESRPRYEKALDVLNRYRAQAAATRA